AGLGASCWGHGGGCCCSGAPPPPPPAPSSSNADCRYDIGCGCGGNDGPPSFAGSRCGCFAGLSAGNCGWKACAAAEAAAALLFGAFPAPCGGGIHDGGCRYVSGGGGGP
ncbi:unnamed protein product, partial [Ectocarpus fasciculatus]